MSRTVARERRRASGFERRPAHRFIGFFSLSFHAKIAALAVVLTVGAPAFAQAPAPSIEKADPSIDVRVEGDRGPPRSPRDPGVASFVVRGEELRRPGASAVDVLTASPSVEPSRSGAGSDFATLSIRGAPSAELPVYLAGVRINDDVTGAADLSTIPLFALDRIEVFRGNAPADADRLGIGGAVFLEPKLPRGTHAGATFGAGSYGALTFGGFASLGDDRAGALFSFSRQSATNDYSFLDDGGTLAAADDRVVRRENGDATTYDAWALGRAALPNGGRLVLIANAFAREQGLSGSIDLPAREARSATQREIGAASVRLPCAFVRGGAGGEDSMDRCAIDLAVSGILARRDLRDPLYELGVGADRASTSGERWEEKIRVRARVADSLRIGAGVFVGLDRLGVDLSTGARTRAASLAVTGSVDVAWRPFDWLEVFAVGAGECHSAVGHTEARTLPQGGAFAEDRGACAKGGPAGRAGVRGILPRGFELLASGGSYVRVPVLGELYGLSGTVHGNASLVPERGTTAEATARWMGGTSSGSARAYADVTGFVRFVDDLIVYRRAGAAAIMPFNVKSARVLGVEVSAGVDLVRHVRASVAITASDPRNTTDAISNGGSVLPYHAPIVVASSLEAYADLTGTVRFVDRVSATVRFGYRSPRFADDAATFRLREQRDLGADVAASFLARRLTARVSVTNLLDATNQDLLGFPQPGRSVFGALEATW